ncbi:MAG: ATPase [Oleispira antarctica]|uniref:ATPase n=1 Tax=Oleispira antarctica RB-8 TaxID=698738 RepID=R4YTC9_OLEAN|nr:ATPase [Oleispira antarctica]MBQ0791890.1 ATPase [Oleispira antarctica]CCK76888.1 conserved hypothetical protein [Oleispira antarctica RB-8]
MEVETLRDVIHWARGVHLQLSECLSECQEDAVDERAKLVLSYLSNYENKLAKVVEKFEESGDEHALNTWCIEYITKFKLKSGEFCDKPFVNLNAQQIVATVVEKHQYLLSFFRFLSMQTAIPCTKELMEELSSFEEHETMKMVQATNRFEDM